MTFIRNTEIIPQPATTYSKLKKNKSTRIRCGICSSLTIKTPERRTYFIHCSSVSIVNFDQVNADWGTLVVFQSKEKTFRPEDTALLRTLSEV